jgi:cell division protein FtsB|tara:strand:- start:642 stop:932 length:291 start_codon:yes stop_codon:yes gene_type:complete
MKNYLIGLFIILIIAIIYLMSSSESSIFTYFKLGKEVKENKEILNSLQKQSEELQGKIKKLESNDLEYVDQLARDKHDMSDPDEIIIFNNKEKKKE